MLQIVTSSKQVFDNIYKFEEEVQRSPKLQDRLAYARAWYAHRDDKGRLHFGPSKFIGQQGITAKKYLETAEDSDGRRTEAQLRTFFKVVDPTSDEHEELMSELVLFLAKFGKAPSTKVRISVSRGDRRAFGLPKAEGNWDHVVQALLQGAAALPTQHLKNLREELEAMWGG